MSMKNAAQLIETYGMGTDRRRAVRAPKDTSPPPHADPADMRPRAPATIEDPVGLRVGIVYSDSRGQESRREITVHAVERRESARTLRAWCHVRQAPRTFLLDRISTVYDVDTGEFLGNGVAFAETYAFATSGPDESSEVRRVATAIASMRPEIQVLVFLARCDGWHVSEVAVACNLVLDAAPDLDVVELERQVRRLDPDEPTFRAALARFSRAEPRSRYRLARAIRRLLAADGALSNDEWRFVDEMATLIEAELTGEVP